MKADRAIIIIRMTGKSRISITNTFTRVNSHGSLVIRLNVISAKLRSERFLKKWPSPMWENKSGKIVRDGKYISTMHKLFEKCKSLINSMNYL